MLAAARLSRPGRRLCKRFAKVTVPVSDFIHDRLYHRTQGYFSKSENQLGFLKEPLDFHEIFGYEDYNKLLYERYPKNAWLTPSEIFKPYYGMTIANYIDLTYTEYCHADPSLRLQPLKVIEVGAGNGSAALSILNFFKLYRPKKYQSLELKVVEISPAMVARCREQISAQHGALVARGQVQFVEQSVLEYSRRDTDLVFVVMLEVLDNMPHDRVYWDAKRDRLEQAFVEMEADGSRPAEVRSEAVEPEVRELFELYRQTQLHQADAEASDKALGVVARVYRALRRLRSEANVFLPTHTFRALRALKQALPNCHLVVSDFDQLLESDSARSGVYAPTVSTKLERSEEKLDHDSYLVARGAADIFFPTDFRLLRAMYERVFDRRSEALKSFEFVAQYSEKNWALTKSGYNPLKEDFANTSFFLTKK